MAWTRKNDFHVHSGRYNVGPRILGKEVKGAGETPALLKTMARSKASGLKTRAISTVRPPQESSSVTPS